MNRRFLIVATIFIAGIFYFGEFVIGGLHFIKNCVPPNKLYCDYENLSGRNFSGIDTDFGEFSHADLSNSDWTGSSIGSSLSSPLSFNSANLSNANFAKSRLDWVDFENSNLIGANFLGATINANFKNANLTNAVLRRTDLSGLSFIDADLTGADLSGADLTGANMSGAILQNTKMPDGTIKTGVMGQTPTNTIPRSKDTQPPRSKAKAVSLTCRDGMVLGYCEVLWSDGQYRPLPMGIGPRRGGVVDGIIYYDLQWNPSCILLYADGSILTSYDTERCS